MYHRHRYRTIAREIPKNLPGTLTLLAADRKYWLAVRMEQPGYGKLDFPRRSGPARTCLRTESRDYNP